jgi:aspartyl-tRNA(Asn)/glutamyl-tRNA(Gln) amidotransferase subunit A
MALSWTLDKLGPIAHSAEDCGLVLQVIAGKDSKDPGTAGKSFYYVPQYVRPVKELKIGYAPVDFDTRPDPAAKAAFQTALDALKQTGVTLVETKLPPFPYGAALSAILNGEQASIFEELITSGRVDQLADPAQIAGFKVSLETPAKDYLKAMRLRRLMQQAFRQLFSDVDAVVAPARYGPATPISQPLDAPPANPLPPNTPPGFSALIPAGNLAGLPALAFPCGFAGDLPVGVQVVGPPFTENTLLAIGNAFQAGTDWHKRRPKV